MDDRQYEALKTLDERGKLPDDLRQAFAAATLSRRGGNQEADDEPPVDLVQSVFDAARNTFRGTPRQLGLTGRYLAEGATAPFSLVGDAANSLINLPFAAYDAVTGNKSYRMPMVSELVQRGLDAAGLPKPEGIVENVVSVPARVLAGAGGVAKAAQIAGQSMVGAPQIVANTMGSSPGTQAAAGVVAAPVEIGTNAATTAITGSPAAGQIIGTLVGSAVPAPTFRAGAGAASGTRAVIDVFREGGREAIVGDILRSRSQDPGAAIANLKAADQLIPNSDPRTAGASKDPGLAGLEPAVEAMDQAGAFPTARTQSMTAAEQQAARLARINTDALERARAKRENVTSPMRDRAFAAAEKNNAQIKTEALTDVIERMLASPDNKRTIVQGALKHFAAKINEYSVDGKISPRTLYAVRKDINDALAGKYDRDGSSFKYARGELMELKRVLDASIEAAAPGFTRYLNTYEKLSRPINQLEALQQTYAGVTNGPPTVTGNNVVSATALRNYINGKQVSINGKGVRLVDVLTPSQMNKLKLIMADINRGQAAVAPGVRVAGSNTANKQMTVGYVLGRAFATENVENPTIRTLTRPLDFVFKASDQALQELLVSAMLDPKLAARLMEQASPERMRSFAEALRGRGGASFSGSVVGTTTTE